MYDRLTFDIRRGSVYFEYCDRVGFDKYWRKYPCNGVAAWGVDTDFRSTEGRFGFYVIRQPNENRSSTILQQVSSRIGDPGTGLFEPTLAIVATWIDVKRQNYISNDSNTFQIVLASDGKRSFAILNYPDGLINWTPLESFAEAITGGFAAEDAKYNESKWLFAYRAAQECGYNFTGQNIYSCRYIKKVQGQNPFNFSSQRGNTSK
jgi:hypothetical protein